MNGGAATRRGRLSQRIAAALTLLTLAAAGAGWALWTWGRSPAPSAAPVPPEVAAADPEAAAGFQAARQRVLQEPQSAAAWGGYGQVLLANNCVPEAEFCLVQAGKLDPTEPRWPYLQGWALLATDHRAALQAILRAADLADRAGTAATATWLQLADVYMEIDDRKQVEAWAGRVLQRDPDDGRAHFDLGMIAVAHDDLDVGIAHLLRAADSPMVHQRACLQLAAAYTRQRKEEEAAKYEWLARQAPPDAVWVDPYVGELNDLKLGREARRRQVRALAAKDSLEQQAVLLKRMADDYGDWQSTMDLGVALTQLKQYDQAEAILRKAETLAPTSSEPSYFLGLALFLHGEQLQERRQESDAREKFRAAADALRTATERRADYAQAHYKLGQTVEKLDRRTEALEAFRTAVRCRPDMANFQLELGKALAAADQKAEAAAHLHEAQELAPDDPRPREALGRLDKGKQPD